jgi:hypothetical protein
MSLWPRRLVYSETVSPEPREQPCRQMKFPRRVYEPQRENHHESKCASSSRERDSGRGREDLVREPEHKVHHATENRLR